MATICASARSTKMTSRNRTCRPRYPRMATSTTQAANGAARKVSTSIGVSTSSVSVLSIVASSISESRGQRSNPQIDQRKVVVDPCDPRPHGHPNRFDPRALGDRFDLLFAEVVGGEQHLDPLVVDLLDQVVNVFCR